MESSPSERSKRMNNASNEFYQRAKNFLKVNPGMAAVVHTVPDAADAERESRIKVDWFTYFLERGYKGVLANCERILSGQGKAITLPCESPEMFDPSYAAPRYKWNQQEASQGTRTRDIAELHAETLRQLRSATPRGQRKASQLPQEPQQSPQEWLDAYQANPPPLPVFSDEFKRRVQPPSAPNGA